MALFDANAEQPGAALARKRRTGYSRGLDGPLLIVVLLVPSLILLIGIIFYPVFNTVLLSFQSLNLADPLSNHWVGLENYTKILTNPVFDFWHSVAFSALYSIVSTVIAFVIGFNSQYGIINHVLTSINLFGWQPFPRPLAWFGGEGKLAIVATIYAAIWNKFPFFTLMLLAGLQTLPQDLIDAATVDGAGVWDRFWNVTVPGMRGIIVITTTLQFIWGLNEFAIIWAMTNGGPGNATNNIVINIYRTGFINESISYAATMGVLWLLMLLVFTYFYIRIMEGGVETR